jgi:NAD(P)-dependent dehydrogenase (short-subunit alcohol dehydrogenase family)
LTNPNVTWDQIENYIKENSKNPGINNYGLSKALLNSYSMALVKEHGSKILVSSISPGWVAT